MKRVNRYRNLFLFLSVILLIAVLPYLARAGWVSGRMLSVDGLPMAGGKAIFFDFQKGVPPDPAEDFRPPDHVAPLDEEGSFRLRLSAGKYYVGAIQWLQSEGPGPPEAGDIFFINREDPLTVKEIEDIDLGNITKGETMQGSSVEGRH